MDVLDALCGNERGKSVVELSLNPLFRRGYSALYKAIEAMSKIEKESQEEEESSKLWQNQSSKFPSQSKRAIAGVIPAPQGRDYWLWGIDTTPVKRGYAKTLTDRERVYQPTPVPGVMPITLGHNYSIVSGIPEKEVSRSRSWAIPWNAERVSSFETGTSVGERQIQELVSDSSMPWYQQKCVVVADANYSHRGFLYPLRNQPNLCIISRCRSNRVFYHQPQVSLSPKRGRPRLYGERFDLKEESTWGEPSQEENWETVTHRGQTRRVVLQRWSNLLMKGSRCQPMHQHPFDLVRIQLFDSEDRLCCSPMWLLVFGQPRSTLTGVQIYHDYLQRFSLEHFFRFAKQHLLFDAFETANIQLEQTWIQLSCLAMAQLWAARPLATLLPPPWQRYLPSVQNHIITPSAVQRDFFRIIQHIGSPASPPQPRGKSPGRSCGHTRPPRPPRPLVKRRVSRAKKIRLSA